MGVGPGLGIDVRLASPLWGKPVSGMVAVVDALRATSTIVTALAAGAQGVLAVADEHGARQAAAGRDGAILAGERDCLPLPGFELGNSPAAFLRPDIRGREVVLSTTNGSRALERASGGGDVVALALLNVAAVAEFVRARSPETLAVVCSGAAGDVGVEDTYVAGALLDRLLSGAERRADGAPAGQPDLTDAARVALGTYRDAEASARSAVDVFLGAAAGRRLVRLGLRGDVEFCAQRDAFAVVPLMVNGILVPAH